jgi:hypothetical protein
VPAAERSPTRISNEATIIRSDFCAACANCELYWNPPTTIWSTSRLPNE